MRGLSLFLVSLLVLGTFAQTSTLTTVFTTEQAAGAYARFFEINVPATDSEGLDIAVTSGNATSEISYGVSVNAPCLFEFGGEPFLGGCLAEANGTALVNGTAFVPAGVAFLSVINPTGSAFTVDVTAFVCDDAGAVGPSCNVPIEVLASGTFDIDETMTYIQFPAITTADGSISTMEITFSSDASFNYTELVFGSLPSEANSTDTEGDFLVSQPFVATEGEDIASGQFYYLGLSAADNMTISFNVTLTNCTSGEYYVITEGDDEECLEIGTLNTNSAAVIELNENFFNDNDWGYFKLNTTFFGPSSSLTIGAVPVDGQLPALYLRCGNLPTEEEYDIVLETSEMENTTALYYSADLANTCTWFLGFYADDGDQKDGLDLWLNSLCPHDCNNNGVCSDNICQCDDTWTGLDCGTAVAPGQSPADATDSPRFWDIDEWSPAAWVAVVLIILLVIAVIALSVGLGVVSKKWNDARRGSYDKL